MEATQAIVTNQAIYRHRAQLPPTKAEDIFLEDSDPRVAAHLAFRAGKTYTPPDRGFADWMIDSSAG